MWRLYGAVHTVRVSQSQCVTSLHFTLWLISNKLYSLSIIAEAEAGNDRVVSLENYEPHPLTGQIYDESYKFASKQEIPASNSMYNQQKVPLFSGLMLNELSSSQADKTILSVPLNLKIMKD